MTCFTGDNFRFLFQKFYWRLYTDCILDNKLGTYIKNKKILNSLYYYYILKKIFINRNRNINGKNTNVLYLLIKFSFDKANRIRWIQQISEKNIYIFMAEMWLPFNSWVNIVYPPFRYCVYKNSFINKHVFRVNTCRFLLHVLMTTNSFSRINYTF